VFIKYPPENSMASFNFTGAVLDEGTASAFGSWFCIADDGGGFSSHLAETREPANLLQHPAATLTTSLMVSAELDFPI
jgi:hypothetical protein